MDSYELSAARNSAIHENNLGRVRWLLVHVEEADANDFLRIAVEVGTKEMCQLLMQMSASRGSIYRNGRSALHSAAESGRVDICRALVAAGADPLFVRVPPSLRRVGLWHEARMSPFQLAVKEGKIEVLRFFVLECGIDPTSVRTAAGRTMIQFAAQTIRDELRSLKVEHDTAQQMKGATEEGSRSRACALVPL